jgi:hypothetical protein
LGSLVGAGASLEAWPVRAGPRHWGQSPASAMAGEIISDTNADRGEAKIVLMMMPCK